MEKADYTDLNGVPHRVLVKNGGEPETGVPLLDLGPLGLPEEIEARLYISLWSRGIREYRDIKQPGARREIAAALRSAFQMAVSEIVDLSEREDRLIEEAGYYDG